MDWDGLLAGLAAFVLVATPVFGLTVRFALNPLLETLIRLREVSAKQAAASDERLLELTSELQRLSSVVQRLEETSSFDRQVLPLTSIPASSGSQLVRD